MIEIKLGIVGSRKRDTTADFKKVWSAYDDVVQRNINSEITIVSGGAYKGGDRFAVAIARDQGGKMITYFPYGHDTEDYYARNTRIAQESDILIACVDHTRRGGTENTVTKFKMLHPDGELIIVE
jgi:predicted Rossmann fold nucleotide-binding protein DprA/Smf involved in DNA uptake